MTTLATPAAPTGTATGTYRQFFDQLLTSLGITPTTGAEAALADVVHEEGANDYFNPFNIEYHPGQNTAWQGVANFNKVGVQEYGSAAQGIAATTAFLQDNPRYRNLLSALKTGDTATIQNALVAEYTWAPFRTATPAQEQAILNQPTGIATSIPTAAGSATSSSATGTAAGQDTSFLGIPSIADIRNLVVDAVFLLTGLGIITLGVFRMSQPVVKKAAQTAKTLAPLAAL